MVEDVYGVIVAYYIHLYTDKEDSKNVDQEVGKGSLPTRFYKISIDRMTSSELITPMKVCILVVYDAQILKGIEVRVPSVKIKYLS